MMRTLTAMFDTPAEAERAITALQQEVGLSRDAVSMVAGGGSTAATQMGAATEDRGLWGSLKDLFVPEDDRVAYAEGVRRGGVLVTVQAEEAHMDRVMDTLEQHGAVDLDERERSWRGEGWTGTAAVTPAMGAATTAMASDTVKATPMARDGDDTISLVEETLRIGKREVDRGRVRVRSYIVETPVEEQVMLREEHVDIQRRAVDRPMTAADAAMFEERTIEVTETSEEAMVAKEARVREELVIRKEVGERTETVRDSVRRTEVEVDDTRVTGTSTVTGGTRDRV